MHVHRKKSGSDLAGSERGREVMRGEIQGGVEISKVKVPRGVPGSSQQIRVEVVEDSTLGAVRRGNDSITFQDCNVVAPTSPRSGRMEETGVLIPFHGKTYMEALAPER